VSSPPDLGICNGAVGGHATIALAPGPLTLAAVVGVGDIPRLPLRTVAADRRIARE
jgi:hypothetical protein